jgi:hypothetical protein
MPQHGAGRGLVINDDDFHGVAPHANTVRPCVCDGSVR